VRSCGFTVAYLSYDTIVQAFASVGIDAAFDEHTEEADFRDKVRLFEALSAKQIAKIKRRLLNPPKARRTTELAPEPALQQFTATLEASLSRGVQGITVVVLHGQPLNLTTAAEAIDYLQDYPDTQGCAAAASKYEVRVRYNTGDVIDAIFQRKQDAVKFLQSFA
jgi:hypothetical protein